MIKKLFLFIFAVSLIHLAKAQNVTFDAKGLLFLSDADMSAFALMNGKLQKSGEDEDQISALTFPLSYAKSDQIKSDKASNSVIGTKRTVAITSDQRLAYVLETKGETNYDETFIKKMPEGFPKGKYVTVINIEKLNKPTSLYRFPVGENPTSIAISPDNKYLAITCEEYGKEIQIYEISQSEQGKPLRIIKKPKNLAPGHIVDLAWHSSGQFLAYINQDEANCGLIRVLRDGPSQQIIRLENIGSPVKIGGKPTLGKFTPDGKYFLILDQKKDWTDKDLNEKGELFVVRFNTSEGQMHSLLAKASVGENPIGFDIHPDGSYILVNNLERSFYSPETYASSGEASLSVLRLEFDGSIENIKEYPLEGTLPASAVFDKTGKNIAYSVYQYLTFGFPFGGIEFLNFDPLSKEIMTPQKGKIYVPRGVNSITVIKEY